MSGKVYTREDLYYLPHNSDHKSTTCKRCLLVKQKMALIEAKIINEAKQGISSLFITDKFLTISPTPCPVHSVNNYREFTSGIRKMLPDSQIKIEADYEDKGRGIYIDWAM